MSARKATKPVVRAMQFPATWAERYQKLYPEVSPRLVPLFIQLRSTALFLDNVFTNWLVPTRLTAARYHLLMVLWGAGVPLTFTQIGAYLTVTRATISALVDGLVQDGLIARREDPVDRRNASITLSSKGETKIRAILDQHFHDMRTAFAGLTDEDLETLSGLLTKFRVHIAQIGANGRFSLPSPESPVPANSRAPCARRRRNAL